MTLRRRLHALAALVRRTRLDRELDDEIAAHLELAERDARARGLSPVDARQAALRGFGGIDRMKEDHRDARSVRWIEHVVADARYGLAALRRDPLFTTVAVAVLALGIGANTAVFSLVDGVLFAPLPFPAPDRIVRVWETPTPVSANSTTALNFVEIARRLTTFDAFAAEAEASATAEIGGEPVRLQGRVVSSDYFQVFGIAPLLGRAFRPDDDRPGAARVLVLSHAAWQQQFGGDPSVLARDVRLDGEPHRVIGVMPPGVFDRDRRRPRVAPAAFWRPLALTPQQLAAGAHWLNPVGRLRDGVTIGEAQHDLLAARAGIAELIPAWKREWSVRVEPFDAVLVTDALRQSLYLALGAVALVLLIACANLTNLLLARGAARQKEMALRAALGAGRTRLVGQLLTESLVLGLLGGLAGVALAAAMLAAAVPLLSLAVPFTADIALNLRVLLSAVLTALVVSIAVGVLPALRASASPAATALNDASRGSSRSHAGLRRAIVGGEVAVSLVLICGAVLLFKSLLRLQQVDVGVQLPQVLTSSIDIGRDKYPTAAGAIAFYDRLTSEVGAIPGVDRVSLSGDLPLEGTGGENLRLPGDERRLTIRFKRAGVGYIETMGIRVAAGRTFTAADRLGAPYVTVINEALAAQLAATFGMTRVLGRVVDLPALGYSSSTTREPMTIVGIVGNERVRSDLRVAPDAMAYVPLAQAPVLWTKLAVRTRVDTAVMLPAMRAAVRRVDERVAMADVRTLEDLRDLSLSGAREPAWLIGIFAGLSALLAALGLYGVVAQAVTEQRREIGIRMALGAHAGDVMAMVLRSVVVMMSGGLLAGVAGAFALTRTTRRLLFEVSAFDPVAFAAAVAVMAAVGVLAALIPARRATRVEPTVALRAEG